MTTEVHITTPYTHTGKKVRVFRRYLSADGPNREALVSDLADTSAVARAHVWDDCELVIREVDADA